MEDEQNDIIFPKADGNWGEIDWKATKKMLHAQFTNLKIEEIISRLDNIPKTKKKTMQYYIHYKEDVKFLLKYIVELLTDANQPQGTPESIPVSEAAKQRRGQIKYCWYCGKKLIGFACGDCDIIY